MRRVGLLAAILTAGLGALALVQKGTNQQTLLTGGLLVAVGLPLLARSRRQLGSAFAIAPQAKKLVTQGLYARIPHPMFVFLDLVLLGGIIVARRRWLLVMWATLIAVQVWQARREASVLEAAFGDTYRAYRTRTFW